MKVENLKITHNEGETNYHLTGDVIDFTIPKHLVRHMAGYLELVLQNSSIYDEEVGLAVPRYGHLIIKRNDALLLQSTIKKLDITPLSPRLELFINVEQWKTKK